MKQFTSIILFVAFIATFAMAQEAQLFIKMVRFDKGSATISSNATLYLMEELAGCDIISIVGYASTEGRGDSNLILSQGRAAYIGATLGKLDIVRGAGETTDFGSPAANRIVIIHYYRRVAKPLAQVTDCNRLDSVATDSTSTTIINTPDTLAYTPVPTIVGTMVAQDLHKSLNSRTFAVDSSVVSMGMPMDEPICITCEVERVALVYARGQLWDRKQEWRAEKYHSAKTRKVMALLVQDIDWLDNEYKACLKRTRTTWDAGFYGNSASTGGGGQFVSRWALMKGGRSKTNVLASKRACKKGTGGNSL